MPSDLDVFRQINNAVLDLQASELQSYERPLKTLGLLFRTEDLKDINRELTTEIDLDAFLKEGQQTRGGFVGSSQLNWPQDSKKCLGLTLLLIEKFAEEPSFALNFGHTYY